MLYVSCAVVMVGVLCGVEEVRARIGGGAQGGVGVKVEGGKGQAEGVREKEKEKVTGTVTGTEKKGEKKTE